MDERRGTGPDQRLERAVGAAGGPDEADALVHAALQVSRAQLLLTGTLDYLPESLRGIAEESLEDLSAAVLEIRSVVVAGRVPPPRAPGLQSRR